MLNIAKRKKLLATNSENLPTAYNISQIGLGKKFPKTTDIDRKIHFSVSVSMFAMLGLPEERILVPSLTTNDHFYSQ